MLEQLFDTDDQDRKALARLTVTEIMDSLEPRDRMMLAMYFNYAIPDDYTYGFPLTPATIGRYIGEKFRPSGRAISGKSVQNRIYLITAQIRANKEIAGAARRVLKHAA